MFDMRIGHRAGAHALEAVRTTIGHSTRSDVTEVIEEAQEVRPLLQGLRNSQQWTKHGMKIRCEALNCSGPAIAL
jgi:hypothetical protein